MSAAPDDRRAGDDEEVLGKAYDAKLMARLWTFVSPHWPLFALSLILIPVAVAFEIAQPYLLKLAIDVNISANVTEGLGTLALLYASFVGLQALTSYGQLYALQLLGQRSMHDLRQRTYRHVITRRSAFFDRVPVGRVLTRMTNDVESINEMFAGGVVTLIADAVKLVAIVGMMFYLNVTLTLITFLTLPALIGLVAWARKIMRTSFRAIRVKLAAMNAHVQEHLSGIKVVQLFCREKKAAAGYDKINAEYRDSFLAAIRADAGMYAVVEAIGIVSVAGIAWYAGTSIGEGVLTVGLVVAFIEYINKFFVPVRDFSAKYSVMQGAMAAVERIFTLLDNDETDPAAAEDHQDKQAPSGPPSVVFDAVEFAYRIGEPVLRGVDLSIEPGQTVAVVGATGSGKSTLIRLLSRLYDADAGTISFAGTDIRDIDAAELRRRLTVVSQDVYLFSGSVADNVRLGNQSATDDDVRRALAGVGADRILTTRGADIDLEVAERGSNFSAGERQLIAFARALVRDPDVLILDEATAHVDPETEGIIEAGLEALMRGRTSLVIAHRLSTIKGADNIAVMSKGRVVETGDHDTLVAKGGLYARLAETFARKHDDAGS